MEKAREWRATGNPRACLFLLVMATALLHLTTVPAAAQTANAISQTGAVATDSIQSGKQGFVRHNCSVCHGSQGQGAVESGPRIAPPGPSFTDFVRHVRQPAGNMPPVSSQRVPDVDLADIYAFLWSAAPLPQAGAPTPVPTPTGDARAGRQGFANVCGRCHGSEGQGLADVGPKISGTRLSFADFVAFVRKPTGDMAPISSQRVPDAALADIYAFLQSVARPIPQ
jgi:mono/diheme cytochrome c family protein